MFTGLNFTCTLFYLSFNRLQPTKSGFTQISKIEQKSPNVPTISQF